MSAPSHRTSASPSEAQSLPLSPYVSGAGLYDELVSPERAVRAHWRDFLGAFETLGPEEKDHAVETARRMLRENGVSYVVQGESEQGKRPWQLDLFPLLIEPEEWRRLESGLVQRARLLNSLLADIYGPQRLLKEGVIPPALVFGSPQFLRPCHGVPVKDDTYLHFVAFDLARGPDGQWWVLSDRSQAPSGIGYALENRIIASHCLPGLFARSQVQRLASFFQRFNENLLRLSARDEPLCVVLSPGQSQEAYFEHAYLARYLGYTVVEGSDLTVRDTRLYLKTVEGLKPVDLVVRRVDSDLCDPLELRTGSDLGVPGLVQAARRQNVVIANALGSGVLESEALPSFLPGISRFFFGEDLAIPSLATWWCGQPRERDYVRANLNRLVVRKVDSSRTLFEPGLDSFIGPELSQAQREELSRQIERRGPEFIGQELVKLSTAPVWSGSGRLVPAPMTLRVYLAATEDGYVMMPGGLTRVTLDAGAQAPWLGQGDVSKDTWVLADGPVDTFSLLSRDHDMGRLRRGGKDLPSRSADNLFWLGRYAERSEGAVRLLRSLVRRLSGEGGVRDEPAVRERLAFLLVRQDHLSQRRAKRAVEAGLGAVERELWTILFDPDCPDGLAKVLANVRHTAELVRERLSHDTWQILQDLTEVTKRARPADPGQEADDALRLLDGMIQHLAAFNGMIMENMTRGFGWRFLDMGRRMERVRHGAKLLRDLAVRGDPEQAGNLDLLLELADSSMTYRTRYKASPRLPAVLDLLLADDSNPRSVLFQLAAFEAHARALPQDEEEEAILSPVQRVVTGLLTDLRLADVARLSLKSKRGVRPDLDRLLKRLESGTDQLSDLVARTYFSHSIHRQVTGPQVSEVLT